MSGADEMCAACRRGGKLDERLWRQDARRIGGIDGPHPMAQWTF